MAEGTFTVPSNYPDPHTQNVNSLPLEFAYGVGNTLLDHDKPSAPGTPVLDSKTTTSVAFHWTAAKDNVAVVAYNIYSGSAKIGSVTDLNSNVAALTSGQQYTFTVTAVDKAGLESAKSAPLVVTTS